ncbi:MAG: diadenylate cyclase CdaA [Abditibacteriota bacterium]|nr:diadenylate cyclase CdaA [Abditibacteriota bacterium]
MITNIILNIVDVFVCFAAVYWIICISKRSRAWQVLWGIGIFIAVSYLTELLKLNTVNFLVRSFMPLAPVALVMLFYPEMRLILENMGRGFRGHRSVSSAPREVIQHIVRAACTMSQSNTGCLIVFERNDSLDSYIENGLKMDASVTDELIRTIFWFGTPLHDGALIIRKGRIVAASCTLPLTRNENYSSQIHTRHKAALGITDITDAFVVVVSEETGIISVVQNGSMTRHLNERTLTDIMLKELLREDNAGKAGPLISFMNRRSDRNE